MKHTYMCFGPLPVLPMTKLLELMRVAAVMSHSRTIAETRYQGNLVYPRVTIEQSRRIYGKRERVVSILINGAAPDHGDPFVFPPPKLEEPITVDTEGKPYDVVVTACLALAMHVLGGKVIIHTTGDHNHWKRGVVLANWAQEEMPRPKEVRHLPWPAIPNPIKEVK